MNQFDEMMANYLRHFPMEMRFDMLLTTDTLRPPTTRKAALRRYRRKMLTVEKRARAMLAQVAEASVRGRRRATVQDLVRCFQISRLHPYVAWRPSRWWDMAAVRRDCGTTWDLRIAALYDLAAAAVAELRRTT